ncbi:MAG: efflux RND transporter periplasmic adaptor subunit [Saprospiraceae bacterium]|nr:efflux RND transporter periplasmic adaptor subunit [Saprospiraceae bacterium]
MKQSILIISLFILVLSCKHKTDEPVYQNTLTALDVFNVRTAPVSSVSGQNVISATGVLMSDLESKPAFKTGGVIERTYFKEGDRISKGALLATLKMTEITAQVDQAKKAVEKTARDLARVKNLYIDSVATLEVLQNAQTAYDMSLESVKIAEFNQSYSKVIAPESGILVKQISREGEIIGPGMPICVIMGVGQAHWVIKAAVSDKEWARIKKGDHAVIRFEAFPEMQLDGLVDKIADISNPGTATLDIEIKLPRTSVQLAVGLIANLDIKSSGTKVGTYPSIPIESLVSSNDGQAIIYVPTAEGTAMKKSVMIDKILGDRVTIRSGLDGIREVITAGAVYLQDGDKISIEK